MTPVEYLALVKDGSRRDLVLSSMLYAKYHQERDEVSPSQIRDVLASARVRNLRKINISDVLGKAGESVHCVRKGMWELTDTGISNAHTLLNLTAPSLDTENSVIALRQVAQRIANDDVRDYIDEAVRCMRVDARRACIVFAWTAAIRVIQERLLSGNVKSLNEALQRHDQRARRVTTITHFDYIKDKVSLLAAQELGLFDKSEKDTLEEALNLRNRCGHPAKYKPRQHKVASFLEDLVSIVF